MQKPRVLVIGLYRGTLELLERRVGGILGNLASVRGCHPSEVGRHDADLLVTQHGGELARDLEERLKESRTRFLSVELTLLPAGVLTLSRLPTRSRIGVIASHRSCANTFLSEIIRSGVVQHRFLSGSIDDAPEMEADMFVMPEETFSEFRGFGGRNRHVLPIPRSVSPYSAAELVQAVLAIGAERMREEERNGEGVGRPSTRTVTSGARWRAGR